MNAIDESRFASEAGDRDRVENSPPESITVRLLPVGMGDCILLRFPDGSWAVIDCGQKRGMFDPPRLAASFIANEDALEQAPAPVRFILVTHPHADHDGGVLQLMQLLGNRKIGAVYYCGEERRSHAGFSGTTSDDGKFSFVNEARGRHQRGIIAKWGILKKGDTWELPMSTHEVMIRVLWPEKVHPIEGKGDALGGDAVNNLSVVIHVQFGKASAVFMGDVEGQVCSSVAREAALLQPNLIKGPHHGARESALLKVLFGSKKEGNRCLLLSTDTGKLKHPHPDFLNNVPRDDGWRIRCTGLAKTCIGREAGISWPVAVANKWIPESLRRALLAMGGRSRVQELDVQLGCCVDNWVEMCSDGTLKIAVAQKSCDAVASFS